MARVKKKASSAENEARKDVHEKAEELIEESQPESEPKKYELPKPEALSVYLSPVQRQQLTILASLNNDTPAEYAKKVLGQYIADRLYTLK